MTDFKGTYFTVAGVDGWASRGTDANGLLWRHASEIAGWDEPPEARNDFTARAQASGSFDAPVFDDNRVISWSGTVMAPTRALRESAKLILGRIGRTLRNGATLTGHDEDGPKSVWGKRAPGWSVTSFGPYGLHYSVAVICPDPYKYGPAQQFDTNLPAAGASGLSFPMFDGTGLLEFGAPGTTGRLTLSNPGTEDAWPVFEIAGPVLGGLSITDVGSGRQIVYAGDVEDGANLLIIDAAAGRAYLNGADRTGELTVKQWWPVPPDGVNLAVGELLGDTYLIDLGDDSAEISSPDLIDEGDGSASVADSGDAPASTIQFATFGPSGQTGTLAVTVRPTYQ